MTWYIRHYHPFPGAIPEYGAGRSRITHPFATLTRPKPGIPFDLHVLSTPPAFILSQNRTLHKKPCKDIRKMTLKKEIDNPYKERTITKTPPPINPTKGPGHPKQATRRETDWQSKRHKRSSTNTLLSSQTTTQAHQPPTRQTHQGKQPAAQRQQTTNLHQHNHQHKPARQNTPQTLGNKPKHRRVENTPNTTNPTPPTPTQHHNPENNNQTTPHHTKKNTREHHGNQHHRKRHTMQQPPAHRLPSPMVR